MKKSNRITVDGNTAVAKVAYACSELATIYPITPSSTMAELCDTWSCNDTPNIFGKKVEVVEMQSEGGASGALHGALTTGTLATTFTASQGLLLMIPNMYKIAGELWPCVMHVSARTIATHALSIFGDHSDVMAVRSTGFAMLCSSSVQEAQDMALISHVATLKSSIPFVHFFDGFRTSHEINTIDELDTDVIKKMMPMDKINHLRMRGISSNAPYAQGTSQNPDIFFQNREACNTFYNATPNIVKETMKQFEKLTGRSYDLFNYYGSKTATDIIVIMGSGATTAIETVNYLNSHGKKYGVIQVHLYRPFSATDIVNVLPKTTKRIAVLDRTKESGADGEPLFKDVVCALSQNGLNKIKVIGGRYGLSSKEFTPSMVNAVFENLKLKQPKNNFTVGIVDDVTNLSLNVVKNVYPHQNDVMACKFFGYGGDGTVSANKSSIKIIGENAHLYGQAYFEYDSKKSGNATISHLRFGKNKIDESYLLDSIDFISVHNQTYTYKYNILAYAKNNATLLLNTEWTDEQLDKMLPNELKREIAKKNINFYTINAYDIAKGLGLGNKINLVMQSAFFKLINIMDYDLAKKEMKAFALKNYGKNGTEVVNKNYQAIDSADNIHKVNYPKSWEKLSGCTGCTGCDYFKNFIHPIESLNGNSLKVSSFTPSGHVPTGTTKYEKRGIANELPKWESANCIQCNMCAFVCPHGAIRPHLIKISDNHKLPNTLTPINAILENEYKFVMQVSPEDCTGCGVCANTCPSVKKALTMVPAVDIIEKEIKNYNALSKLPLYTSKVFKPFTIKGSQFLKPYFEYSGACAGCGETPYIKVLTQLYGKDMIVANATGCSSIYGGSAPTIPYAIDESGNGPAWANSLFEDNAEFGLGIKLGVDYLNDTLKTDLHKLNNYTETKKININNYLNANNSEQLQLEGNKIIKQLQDTKTTNKELLSLIHSILSNKNRFKTDNMWIIGGDGWAYDIGFGGLDHVLASGNNVNVLVLNTEVYSNTGGQASKATPLGSVAKFASGGKRTNKKDLAMCLMTYKNIYVAQVAMGANMNQYVTALKEAHDYNGPSIIIAYAPCINHGIKMNESIKEEARAVESGYWNLFRYNPSLIGTGKNPFILDSGKPTLDYSTFLMGETRYSSLSKTKPDVAKVLFKEAQTLAEERYNELKDLADIK